MKLTLVPLRQHAAVQAPRGIWKTCLLLPGQDAWGVRLFHPVPIGTFGHYTNP